VSIFRKLFVLSAPSEIPNITSESSLITPTNNSMQVADVAIVGAGIAGLATALALYRKKSTMRVAVLSPKPHNHAQSNDFGSNQPAIASHPHFSKDNNLLSQWTSFCIAENDKRLNEAYAVNPAVVVARGRWQVAQSQEHANDLQARTSVFNSTVERKFHADWNPNTGQFGAMWLPSAWAISPHFLRTVWMQQLIELGCRFIDAHVRTLVIDRTPRLQYESNGAIRQIDAAKIVLCSPACLQDLLRNHREELPMNDCLPLIQWPGQSKKEVSADRTAAYGRTTVQNESYAIPLGGNEWLVRDEQETGTKFFRGDRWHSPDRLPYLGPMFDTGSIADQATQFWKNDLLPLPLQKNIFINSAHGTRGLLSGIAGASVVADMLLGVNTSLPQTLATALNPNRYIRRALRQHFRHLQSSNKIL
jgi:glycine/D-amino acid oxidase-like deaminating enzyme